MQINLSSFEKLEKMEKENGFTESTIDKEGKEINFFFLVQKIIGKKFLSKNLKKILRKNLKKK